MGISGQMANGLYDALAMFGSQMFGFTYVLHQTPPIACLATLTRMSLLAATTEVLRGMQRREERIASVCG